MAQPGLRNFAKATARAAAGATLFAFPLLMTMEMWWLGQYMDQTRLLVFMLAMLPMLVGLSHFAGFEETFDWREDLVDVLVAVAIGTLVSAVLLALFGVLTLDMSWTAITGILLIQAAPAAIGALLGQKQLGSDDPEAERKKHAVGPTGSMFLMGVGALFVSFNVAPTEEMILIAHKMTPWHALALMALSIVVLHAFVYAIGFYGEERYEYGVRGTFFLVTLPGYAIALLISLFVLWIFGRIDGYPVAQVVTPTVVLGFPAALGAAAARLIL